MTEYSGRLGKIVPEQFQAALARFGLGDFVRAEPIPSGLFGQNVFLTSTQGEYVLRGVAHYDWQFPTERFFVEQLHRLGAAPVPYPYLIDPDTDIFGWSYVIMPRLPGISLLDKVSVSRLSDNDRRCMARALAAALAKAQTLTWKCSGKYNFQTDQVQPFEGGYASWVVERIREKVAKACSYNSFTTASDRDWAEALIAGARDALTEPAQPCVVFGDYGEHNVVFGSMDGNWRVSGVFDLMTAHFGDGEADLSLPVTDYLRQNRTLADAFVQEYVRLVPVRPGFVQRAQVHMLNLKLSFWEYWQRERGGQGPGRGGQGPGRGGQGPGRGGPPEDLARSLSLEQWAGPSIEYWEGLRIGA